VADPEIADAVSEGLFNRAQAQPQNFAIAVERGRRPYQTQQRSRRRPQAPSVEELVNDAVETAQINGTYPPLLNLDDLAAAQRSPLEQLLENAEEARNAPPLYPDSNEVPF